MKILLLFTTLFVWCQKPYAQFAIVKDKDGFVNVRNEPATTSEIADTINSGRIVYCMDLETEWVMIDYPENGFSHSGYVHRSRLLFLHTLKSFNNLGGKDSEFRAGLDSMEVSLASRKFSPEGRKLAFEKYNGVEFLLTVDGKNPWGTDGRRPKYQYSYIRIKEGNKEIVLEPAQYSDLFEPNLDLTQVYFDPETKRIYLAASNGDGAGAYAVLWVIESLKFIHREVTIPF